MIKVDVAKWGQTVEDLRLAALNEPHPRSRERFQALYLIASGRFNATACAAHIGRQDETVLRWAHRYNRHGPDALAFRHTGGRSPLLLHRR
jgi:transposase